MALLFLSASALAGCQTSGSTSEDFPILLGEAMQSDIQPCNGYGSYKDYMGNRYYVSGPGRYVETVKTAARRLFVTETVADGAWGVPCSREIGTGPPIR